MIWRKLQKGIGDDTEETNETLTSKSHLMTFIQNCIFLTESVDRFVIWINTDSIDEFNSPFFVLLSFWLLFQANQVFWDFWKRVFLTLFSS